MYEPVLIHRVINGKPQKACILAANRSAIELYGYSEDELKTMAPHDLAIIEPIPSLQVIEKQMEEFGRTTLETIHKTKGGRVIPVEINSRLIEYDGEKAIMANIRDITSRKNGSLTERAG